ncbi:MAG: long-chain fatty acid--CoA ligase [Archangiaceae bacterium]|nr:long-chain fatty acid--CoA ligase [Archangiaceae bacterium]
MTALEKMTEVAGGSERNLVELLYSRVRENRGPAVTHKVDGKWVDVGWASILEEVKKISAGLTAAGVQPGDRVAIFGATTLTWVLCDLAISATRAVCVPIYASNTPDEVEYILQNSGASVLFVDNDAADSKQPGRLSRVRAKLGACPGVKKVVLFEGAAGGERETTLAKLVEGGAAEAPEAFDARVKALEPGDLCHFIYTSGTTGNPKGVMLTQANWAYEAKATRDIALMEQGDAVMLFLPLAHSFAQVVKACWLGMGFRLVFAESIDKLIANLPETQPSILPAVPRVFEKVFAGVQANAMSAPGLKGRLARWAFRLFDEYVEAMKMGRPYDSLGWSLAKKLVFAKVKATLDQRMGGKMRLFISGGAPLSPKIAYFFDLIGFQVLEGFGLTETSAATTVNRPGKAKIGTVGVAVPGSVVKIASDGEILIKGPGVMKGYYQNEAATNEVLEADGWFHTGDIGEIDHEGYVRITDRKKDIIVTAGGKNVAPQNLENSLKTYPIVSSAMVHGDKRAYLTVLICVNEEAGKKLLAEKGVTVNSYPELVARPEIREAVQKTLDALNADQPPYNTLKRFALMDHDFTQETGELTPTLKVKRKFCTQKYQSVLDGLYDEKRVE